jgi:hypothetical protein
MSQFLAINKKIAYANFWGGSNTSDNILPLYDVR